MTQRGPQENFRNDIREFAQEDPKGRVLGARASLYEIEYTPFEEDPARRWRAACSEPAGRYFCFRPHAMRGGAPYGASHREQRFATDAERAVAVERYFAAAARRAAQRPAR